MSDEAKPPTKRYTVRQDVSSYGFTRSKPLYRVTDTHTNLDEDDEFSNKRLASQWASHLNRTQFGEATDG